MQIQRVLILIDPLDPVTERALAEARLAGATLNLELVEREVASQTDIEGLFGTIQPGEVDGVLILSPNLRSKFTALTLRLASERRLPLASHQREWVERGPRAERPAVAGAGPGRRGAPRPASAP